MLREAGKAHHLAFAHVNGEDAEWPAWYAHWLLPRLGPGCTATETTLAAALTSLDAEHRRTAGVAPWPEFYAERLAQRLG